VRRGAWLYAGLLVLAFALSLGAQESGADSPVPSVTNRGPRGLAVLKTWLEEAGVGVMAHDAPLTALPPGAGSVVLAAPAGDEVREDEVEALLAFARAGGTLVLLVPRAVPQPALRAAFQLSVGPATPLAPGGAVDDVGGSTVEVLLPGGLLSGASQLRLAAEPTLVVGDPAAVAVTSPAAGWWLPLGAGEAWLFAGADLAENARLELADNAAFWSRLGARGPVVFDEFHHHRGSTSTPLNVLATVAQLAFCAALFVWARAPRLGPPRDPPPRLHRSALEYVGAMAALLRSAQVEGELVEVLRAQLRGALHERLGIPREWSWADAAAEAGRRGEVDPADVAHAERETNVLALSRRLARVERALGA
jgi:hypothetical protein